MSATPAAVTLRPFLGWLHPTEGEAVDPSVVLAHLRSQGVLGSVQAGPVGVDEECTVVLLVDDVDRVQVLRDGKVRAGAPLSTFGPSFAEELGLELLMGDEAWGGFDDADEEDEDPDVLLCRAVDSSLPLLAHSLGGLDAGHVDGWTVALFDEPYVALDDHGWLPGDLPALLLRRDGRTREIQVLTSWSDPVGHALTREPDLVPAFDEVDDPAVAALTNPHLAVDSDLRAVLAHPRFRHLDVATVAGALQSPMDEGWSVRVLAALGLPTLAGDLHEGRATLPDATRFQPAPITRTVVDSVLRYYDAPPEEVARRSVLGRLYDRVQRNRVAAGAVVGAEVLASAAMLAASVRPGRGSGARTALATGAVVTLLDATLGTALAVRRFSRQ
ncbi:hypothetical protein [Nocardioides jishulii]|uniref:Uncharacterized protein n=1 Tax=Nocardioides jishulii TaxID=2575440 RepID=A0A4V5TKP4_9ACTN|nr:hypothetical protein [Nocardioides jishulii]QCX28614.1 hypothetical protein FCL41_14535 [Nocardioides jishulii]TKI64493.1 hypothetical protein FC770_05040 [Nocardioides jishulii]